MIVSRNRAARRLAMAATALSAVLLAATGASAGECPADRIVAQDQKAGAGATMPSGVTDTVRASFELDQEIEGLGGRLMRLRELVVEPGGEVPWHSHGDRPAMIYIVEGSITEYASNCAVPIEHVAGDVAPETHAVSHWWKNNGTAVSRLISVDIFNVRAAAQETASRN